MEYNNEYFSGKTAVVTGAASGIGLALIEELLVSNAAKVVMADINVENLNKHEARLKEQYGDRVKGIVCNVMVDEEIQNLINQSADFFDGSFDLLFNNAGAGFPGWFADMTNEDWKKAFDLNFFSAVYSMRAVLPIMVKQGGGQIINIISGVAFMQMANQSRYAATKAALNALSLTLRSEYWDDNIKISSATPGTTITGIWGELGKAPDFAQTSQQSASRILNGVVNNVRIIIGDDSDIGGVSWGSHPEANQGNDEYLLNVARERRKGIMAF